MAHYFSFGLSATSQQYFSLRTNQPSATSQQYFSLRTNQHQPSATSQPNRHNSRAYVLILVPTPNEQEMMHAWVVGARLNLEHGVTRIWRHQKTPCMHACMRVGWLADRNAPCLCCFSSLFISITSIDIAACLPVLALHMDYFCHCWWCFD
jgi:hypothetical protein